MSKVKVDVYHDSEYKSTSEIEGARSVIIYGSAGSARYDVKDTDAVLKVVIEGTLDPETGEPTPVEVKEGGSKGPSAKVEGPVDPATGNVVSALGEEPPKEKEEKAEPAHSVSTVKK